MKYVLCDQSAVCADATEAGRDTVLACEVGTSIDMPPSSIVGRHGREVGAGRVSPNNHYDDLGAGDDQQVRVDGSGRQQARICKPTGRIDGRKCRNMDTRKRAIAWVEGGGTPFEINDLITAIRVSAVVINVGDKGFWQWVDTHNPAQKGAADSYVSDSKLPTDLWVSKS